MAATRTLSRSFILRRLFTSTSQATAQHVPTGPNASPGAQLELFDGPLKALHRDRASRYPPSTDPLVDEVASRLIDRMEDCTRGFPSALVLGGAGLQIIDQLLNKHQTERTASLRGGIERLTVVDTSPGMLERVKTWWQAGDRPVRADFILGDSEREILPVDPDSFDVVISCLGLHWVNDVPGIMAQCRFALKPDGLFLAAMLGGDTLQELRIACTIAQQEREGGVSPRTSPLAQVRDAGNLLTRAGLAIPTVDVDDITVQYEDVLGVVRHLREMGEGNAVRQRREALPRDTALASAAVYMSLFSADKDSVVSGREGEDDVMQSIAINRGVPATFQIVYMTGWAPDPRQRGPARRGSATVSLQDLSEALGEKGR